MKGHRSIMQTHLLVLFILKLVDFHYRKFMKNVVLVFCMFFFNEAFACSCGGPNIQRMHGGANLVVLAKLKSKKMGFSLRDRKYFFEAKKVFKGTNVDGVEVWTKKSEITCGLNASYNENYVLFIYHEEDKLYVDHCSSWPLTKDWYDYTHEFNKFYNLTKENALRPDSRE